LNEQDAAALVDDVQQDKRQLEAIRLGISKVTGQLQAVRSRIESDEPLGDDEVGALVAEMRRSRSAMLRGVREMTGLLVGVRLERIVLPHVELAPGEAVDVALDNRLDLMNRRAFLMDARRRLEIAADRLEAEVNVIAEGEVSTKPLLENDRPFDLRAKESSFRTGISVVTPLDRRAARNNFRAAQIAYQRARRNYMAAEDQVKLDVRKELRDAKTQGAVFEVNRRALRIAARELDQAIEFAERPGGEGSAGGQGINISRALNNILNAQNRLIEAWVEHEESRLALYRNLGIMHIDESGTWANDPQRTASDEPPGRGESERGIGQADSTESRARSLVCEMPSSLAS
jgi:hypothetical protein